MNYSKEEWEELLKQDISFGEGIKRLQEVGLEELRLSSTAVSYLVNDKVDDKRAGEVIDLLVASLFKSGLKGRMKMSLSLMSNEYDAK